MIELAFNLQRLPFTKDLKPADLYQSEATKELTARLEHLRQHHGLFLLTGDPGTGKTAALRGWAHSLSDTNHKIVYVPLTSISPCDLYLLLNEEFAGQPAHRKSKLFKNLQAAIRNWINASRRLPILIFDDAHLMPDKTLVELPMLLSFDMDSVDPLVVVLSGHERLAARLRSPLLRHLDQRVCLRLEFKPLDADGTAAYIKHRLQIVGGSDDLFQPAAINAIHKVTRGTLRLIDRIATDALTLAALDKRHVVTDDDVYSASKAF